MISSDRAGPDGGPCFQQREPAAGAHPHIPLLLPLTCRTAGPELSAGIIMPSLLASVCTRLHIILKFRNSTVSYGAGVCPVSGLSFTLEIVSSSHLYVYFYAFSDNFLDRLLPGLMHTALSLQLSSKMTISCHCQQLPASGHDDDSRSASTI